ncbi:integrase [Streptomyces sp. NPDC006450]|uniref:integrase n=1 Tax=Streptomyces sp. NPDC006450 TaxID=3155458 RepID=UPI0033B419C9
MLETGDPPRDLISFVLPQTGALVEMANPAQPYVLLDATGAVVEPVSAFFAELQACSRPPSTIRSYGMDLLRWWRFLNGVGVEWHRSESPRPCAKAGSVRSRGFESAWPALKTSSPCWPEAP